MTYRFKVQRSMFGSNKFFLLKMFTITCDGRTHSYQSSRPKLECLRAAHASSLAHQITNFSVHSFYAACGSW